MHEHKPKVVYVMGAGRSGSTILGVTLGNCAGVFYAGELNLWPGKAGRSPLSGDERARFWESVRERVTIQVSGREARMLEQSTALFRIGSWRAQQRLRGRYRRLAEQLYQAIARAAGATHIVDSSHFPRRALELQRVGGIDLYLLFLIRDPRDVVASYSRDDKVFRHFNTLNTNIYLWLTYALSLFVFLRHPRDRRLLVRYETLVSAPERVLQDILDCIDSSATIPDFTALKTGFAFQGNRIVRSDTLVLQSQPRKSPRGSRVTAVLSLPWAALFARLRPAAGASAMPVTESRRASVPSSSGMG